MTLAQQLLQVMVCGLPSWKRNKRLFAMLTFFADDSGSDKTGPVFVLSGYVAHADRWMEFSDKWGMALKSGPRPLDYFKMSEATVSGKGQFKKWKKPARDAKILEMAKIIRQYASFNVTGVLWWNDFSIIQKQYPYLPMSPYLLLFTSIMKVATLHVMRKWPEDETIKFVFDYQGKIGRKAVELYRRAKPMLPQEMVRRIAGPPSHEDDKVFLTLQSADMIAWCHRRFCYKNEKHKRNYKAYEMTECMKLLDEIPTAEPVNLDGKNIKSFFEKLRRLAAERIKLKRGL